MTDNWELVAELFAAALELPAEQWTAFIASGSAGRVEVEREVLAMLAAHEGGVPLLLEDEGLAASADLAAEAELAPGTRLGPWEIVQWIGRGGMGEVYRGARTDGAYIQTAAIKVLRPGYGTAEAIRHFRVERQALARLVHPGIAAILDGGSLPDGRPYLVLQYVDGSPITQYADSHALSIDDRLRLFVQVARAVEFAHSQLVIHRDVKPANILVGSDGTPRLLDFGIARLLDPELSDSLARPTRPGRRILTPEHAAPEQIRGEPCDTRTDVYGLGVLLYELLAGRTPFADLPRSLPQLERAVLERVVLPPSTDVADRARQRALRGDLDHITLMALRKEPARRYASAAALADDIESHLAGRPVRAQPDRLGYRIGKFLSRNRALVAAASAVVALILLAAGAALLQARRATRERDRAERERAQANEVVGILTGLFDRTNPRKFPGGDTVRVSALLDEAEQRVEQLAGEPERQAALLRAVAQMHAARAHYDRAEQLLRRSVAAQWKARGPDDLEAARTWHELANLVNLHLGAGAALPLFDSSLSRFRRLESPGGKDLHQALLDVATVTPDHARARALIGEAIAMERRTPNTDSLAIAERLSTEATERWTLGRPQEALALFEATMDIVNARLPPDHPDRITVANNFASALSATGAYAQAESLQRAAVAAVERIREPADALGSAHEHLALTLANEGRLSEAEQEQRQALSLYRSALPADHPSVENALRNLGLVVAREGRELDGLALLDSSIALSRNSGRAGEEADYKVGQRVPILLRLGRVVEARANAAQADSSIHATLPYGHSRYNDVDRWSAMVAFADGDFARAEARASAALTRASETRSLEPIYMAQFSCLLGAAVAAQGRAAEALPRLTQDCPVYSAWGYADPLISRWGRDAQANVPHAR